MNNIWQVLIVEDDVLTRDFFAASVARHPELALAAAVGSVADAKAALDDASLKLDAMLVDLNLPDGSGLEVIAHAREHRPECESLVISVFGDEDNVLASIEAGALGYIHKDALPADIASVILEMKTGASPISPMIARRVLTRLTQRSPAPVPSEPTPDAPATSAPEAVTRTPLTAREQEALELIARGFSYAEIARLWAVSKHTVQSHIKNLYTKLQVHSKTAAVHEASLRGLLANPGNGGRV